MIHKAIRIALEAHRGQVDKAGRPYLDHVWRVMNNVSTTTEKTVALLHDVIEDSGFTLEDLRNEGFSEEVVKAVALLTREKGENYQRYITVRLV